MGTEEIIDKIRQGNPEKVYYLHGEEEYLIDSIVEALDTHVLNEGEKAFNREVFYGTDNQVGQVLNACRSFPVMAQRRLIILKEAQKVNKQDWSLLESYLQQPVASSVLALVFKGKNMGLPKSMEKAFPKAGVNFFAKKMYDRDVQVWVGKYLEKQGYKYDPEIPQILTTNLGINLNLIENELKKIFLFLQANQQSQLKKDLVYEMINVDKSFNVFELIHSLSTGDTYQAHMIMDRLTQNAKTHPPVLVLSNLFRFFHHLALVHTYRLKDPNSIKHQLKVNYFQAKDYASATRVFSLSKTYRNIRLVQAADMQLKGRVPTLMSSRHILKTLLWQLIR